METRTERERRRALEIRDRGQIARGIPAASAPLPLTGVGVFDRCDAILRAVEDGARSLPSIRAATGLTRSTTHRLVDSLVVHGFLFHVGGLGYALGPRLLGLAATALRELPLRQLARPALERLARATSESAQLYIRDGDERVCIDSVESERELRTIVGVGASLPLTAGSAGKVFLAWGPRGRLRIGPDLDHAIGTTRRRGWADSYEERESGVSSVSAPVFGPPDELLAAVSISGPRTRMLPLRAKEHAPAVLEAAREIERALGAEI